ncbi:prolipoprotein diacylglyceryl transferase [Fodinisporobacter ferrooxydans]|uniref:Phosphatidylglycerol--prolipoprotein diacylglyceryl transferase n=1 Tax=Fodinisporobacter ferrooxydans TaxID=2901836 RepID=A0ABY4CP98_9BACL|nr:prolipoprotein diacylglyceryl transferase [Alicyclobacillaceae bacterium MYW30-H2]
MHQFWFYIGSFPIRAYSTIFVSAFLLGLGVTIFLAKVEGKKHLGEHLMNLAPLLFLGGILGARFWQVFFFDWSYYKANPGEIIKIWHGGLSIQGGVVGALLVALVYIYKHKLSFWELADLVAPGMILGQSIGRDANLMNGDAFGGPTGGNFGILYPENTLARQTYGDQPLWPAEVWEGQLDVIIFALLLVIKQRRLPKGSIFLLYNILYNIGRFFLEMLRGDSPRFLFGWDAAQWSSAVIILIALALLVYVTLLDRKQQRRETAEQGNG